MRGRGHALQIRMKDPVFRQRDACFFQYGGKAQKALAVYAVAVYIAAAKT
ncbi:hypothetical protein SDC9_124643 [bioreactor metagenome]|uniref:Uncharacterized protein n=1 Tax=bioreactor metagenome TaxID=1076179 RepID=A0A645CKZ9_9ZZZZ